MNSHAAVVRALDDHTHVTECLQGRQGILALEETFDFGRAFGQRAEHDRTVGNRLVARYADSPGQAATRLGQENQIVGVHSVHIGPAGQDFTEMLAGNPCAGEYTQQLVPVPSIDRVAQGVEVAAKCVQGAQDRLAVGEEDVVPHGRIATGDSREIAETTRSVPEDLEVFIALGQRIDQAEGQQVRQVAGRGQHLVVALHRHVLDIGAQRAPQAVDQSQGGRVGFGQRREDDFVTTEQGSVGGFHPALLGTGDRVAGHEAWQALAEHFAGGAYHIALGAADIGDHGIAQLEPSQAGQELFHGQDRHRQLNDIGADAGAGEVFLAAIDHAQGHGLLARGGIQVDTDHFAAQAAFT